MNCQPTIFVSIAFEYPRKHFLHVKSKLHVYTIDFDILAKHFSNILVLLCRKEQGRPVRPHILSPI